MQMNSIFLHHLAASVMLNYTAEEAAAAAVRRAGKGKVGWIADMRCGDVKKLARPKSEPIFGNIYTKIVLNLH